MHYHVTRDKKLEYISKMSVELKKMAQDIEEPFLSLILDMAAMEARRCLSNDEPLASSQRGDGTPAHQ